MDLPHVARTLRLAALLSLASCRNPPPHSDSMTAARPPGAAFVALYSAPSVLERQVARVLAPDAAASLAGRFREALAVAPTPLSPTARVIVQNDVWGLWQRLDGWGVSTPERDLLRRLTARVIVHLALRPEEVPVAPDPAFATVFSASDGWREQGIGVPDMEHDRLFGYRREYHLFTRASDSRDRALVNHMLALDSTGTPRATALVGGVERILPSPATPRVEVFDRDRAAVGEGVPAMVAERTLTSLPSHGANGTLLRLDGPTPLSPALCMRCHHDLADANFTDPQPSPDPRRNEALRRHAAHDAEVLFALAREAISTRSESR